MRRLLPVVVLPGLLAPAAQARVDPVPIPPAVHPRDAKAERVVAFAERQVGVPARWGGISRRTGFDCSGLVYAAYRSIGRTLPHSTWGQMALGVPGGFRGLRPGDLVFTNGGGPGALVSYVSLRSLQGGFVGARRLLR